MNPNGGDWTDASNWDLGNVPDNDNEVAVLGSLGPPYTVTLSTSLMAGGLNVNASNVTLAVDHGTFTLEGVVISKRGRLTQATFTVRRVSFGVGIERIFPSVRSLFSFRGGTLAGTAGAGTSRTPTR